MFFLNFKKWSFVSVLACVLMVSGCATESYPAGKLEEALREICKTEYGIENIRVKIEDQTIGVYLPLDQLFSSNFKEMLAAGGQQENIFDPDPDALDKIEDVLFSISRVLLSTDMKLDFYVLQATDIESTGLQLVLKGAVNDVKRVRVWDIPRSEYRRRVIHEIRLNQAVIWHRPIRAFYRGLVNEPIDVVHEKYLVPEIPISDVQKMFTNLYPSASFSQIAEWEIQDIRSTELNQRSAVVYTKVVPKDAEGRVISEDGALEYLFIVSMLSQGGTINRIIPFQYINQAGVFERIDFPEELQIGPNLSKWNKEFTVAPMTLGVFLSEQLTKRVQMLMAQDERIRNTIREAKLEFNFQDFNDPSHFELNVDVSLRDLSSYKMESVLMHEDMRYLLGLASREFVNVLRGYSFEDYGFLQVNVVQDPNPVVLERDQLELFRRNKIDLPSLLSSSFLQP